MSAAWTLDIGGVRLTLKGPSSRVKPFARAWNTWAGTETGWTVNLIEDKALPVPNGHYFAARPRFERNTCLLERAGFFGEITPQAREASLRLHPAGHNGDIAYFIRTVFALAAFDQQKLLFHAAGIVHGEKAHCLFGHSGSGKTTASRLSKGKPVLSDDLLLLSTTTHGIEVWATPFGRRRCPDVRVVPLRALLQLIQASEDRLIPMSRGEALVAMVANSPVVNANAEGVISLMDTWVKVLTTVPAHRLYFRRANTFWEVIDAYFG